MSRWLTVEVDYATKIERNLFIWFGLVTVPLLPFYLFVFICIHGFPEIGASLLKPRRQSCGILGPRKKTFNRNYLLS